MIPRRHARTGLSYVEVVVSLAIIATSITASLRALGSYAMGRQALEDKLVAVELANQLMTEINELPFAEDNASTIGPDAGEMATNRATFDDIDDYHNWSASPPRDRANAVLSRFQEFRQEVTVEFDASIPNPPGGAWAAGTFKKITVRVSKGDRPLATLVTIRSRNNANR